MTQPDSPTEKSGSPKLPKLSKRLTLTKLNLSELKNKTNKVKLMSNESAKKQDRKLGNSKDGVTG